MWNSLTPTGKLFVILFLAWIITIIIALKEISKMRIDIISLTASKNTQRSNYVTCAKRHREKVEEER